MQFAVRFERVTKTFAHHAGQLLLRDRIRYWLSAPERFRALCDVSFELRPGESIGLIGANGAGKSTVLNLATGLVYPDSGAVQVNGKIAALLELGAGFHPDLTGAENVRVNAALMGLNRREAAARFEQIVEFSGIREFIHEPLRTYSSGMSVRLAFSVAAASEPDILLIDEVLGVGDESFYRRSLDKIRSFQHEGKAILLASHSVELIRTFCNRAMWLDRGRVLALGEAGEVMDAYLGSVAQIP